MKTIVILLISGLIAIPLLSWAVYGNMGEILPWFGLIAVLALAVIIVNKIQGKETVLE
jgi:cytochrome b561